MNFSCVVTITALAGLPGLVVSYAYGGEESLNWLHLQRMKQQSQERLELIQQHYPSSHPSSLYALERERLIREQQSGLLRLQAQQRRQMLIDGHRHRAMPDHSATTLRQRQQFQLMRDSQEQRHLLNRYRLQLTR